MAPDAAFFALFDLADQLGVPPNSITVQSYAEDSWPSSALGCPEPGTIYLPVVTDGWQVILATSDDTYEYHVDEAGDILRNCTLSSEQLADSINVVELADLRTTTLIEMRRRDASGDFVLKNSVTEPDEITAIVDTLDVPLLPQPAASCTEIFRLVFVTASGNHTFGTICGGQPHLLRGDQTFWSGQDTQAPPEFGAIIGPYFAAEPLPQPPQ